MISLLSLPGLVRNKGRMGTRKEGKKHHLFPYSLSEIAVIISAASHFQRGFVFLLNTGILLKTRGEITDLPGSPQKLTGAALPFPAALTLTPGKRKVERKPKPLATKTQIKLPRPKGPQPWLFSMAFLHLTKAFGFLSFFSFP